MPRRWDATGQYYLQQTCPFPIGVRLFQALMWQQNANIFTMTAQRQLMGCRENAVTAMTQLLKLGWPTHS